MNIELTPSKNWYSFDNRKSIACRGSESGKIIYDIENINGARITIESNTIIAPYAVTLGVYSFLFHTHYTETEQEAKHFSNQTASRIDDLFSHLSIPDQDRESSWTTEFNKLTGQICEQN